MTSGEGIPRWDTSLFHDPNRSVMDSLRSRKEDRGTALADSCS